MPKRSGDATPDNEPGKRQRVNSQPNLTTTQPSSSTRKSRVVTVVPTKRGAVRTSAMNQRSPAPTPLQPPPTNPLPLTTPEANNVNSQPTTTEVSSATDTSPAAPAPAPTTKPKRQRGTTHVCSWSHSRPMYIIDQ